MHPFDAGIRFRKGARSLGRNDGELTVVRMPSGGFIPQPACFIPDQRKEAVSRLWDCQEGREERQPDRAMAAD